MQNPNTTRSPQGIAGAILTILPGLVLIVSSLVKLAGVPAVRHEMASIGFADGKLIFIATLEIISAALFLWPRTRSVGVLLVSAYLGGAICAHVQAADYAKALRPAILLAVIWAGTWLRHPQMLWSFPTDALAANQLRQHSQAGLISREA
jgi:hypothetical protein